MAVQIFVTYVLSAVTVLLLMPNVNKSFGKDGSYKHDPIAAVACTISSVIFITFGLSHDVQGIVFMNIFILILALALLLAAFRGRYSGKMKQPEGEK